MHAHIYQHPIIYNYEHPTELTEEAQFPHIASFHWSPHRHEHFAAHPPDRISSSYYSYTHIGLVTQVACTWATQAHNTSTSYKLLWQALCCSCPGRAKVANQRSVGPHFQWLHTCGTIRTKVQSLHKDLHNTQINTHTHHRHHRCSNHKANSRIINQTRPLYVPACKPPF